MSSRYGYVGVRGHVLPVTDMHMCHGEIWVVAEATGPLPAVTSTVFTLYGRDGEQVATAHSVERLAWEPVAAGEAVRVMLPLRLARGVIEGAPC